jgi:crossover junction endodeoxyribonuclease RuvC
MLILGIDPGLRATGFALVEGGGRGVRLLEHGVIRTDDRASLARRLHEIHDGLIRVLVRTRPAQMAVEDLYAAQRYPRTAILMGHVRGVVCLAAAEEGVEVSALPPAAVKQAISGFGGATKGQVQRTVQRLLRARGSLDHHAADATAMALTALSRAGIPLHAEGGVWGGTPRAHPPADHSSGREAQVRTAGPTSRATAGRAASGGLAR